MTIEFIAKAALIFFAGALFALISLHLLTNPETLSILGQKNVSEIESQVKEEVHEQEKKAAKSITQTIIEKVLPAAQENPVLAPVIEAKRDVEQTVNTLRSLPEEQKSAICRQVCSP